MKLTIHNKTRKMLIFTETNNKRPFGSQSKVVHKFTKVVAVLTVLAKWMDSVQKNRGTCTLNKNIEHRIFNKVQFVSIYQHFHD